MKVVVIFIVVFLSTCGCNSDPKPEDSNQAIHHLSDQTGIGINVIKMLAAETKCKTEHLKRTESETVFNDDTTYVFKKTPAEKSVLLPGVWACVSKSRNLYDVVKRLRNKINYRGYRAFICDGKDLNQGSKIAIVQSDDEFTPLIYMQTNGINQGFNNVQIIAQLKLLNEHLDLKLLGADFDWCEFEIGKEPEDWYKLAKQLYKFCPDIVDQGAGSVEKLAEEMKSTKRLYLWFD